MLHEFESLAEKQAEEEKEAIRTGWTGTARVRRPEEKNNDDIIFEKIELGEIGQSQKPGQGADGFSSTYSNNMFY